MEVLSYQVDGRQCLLAGVNLKRDAAPDAARRRWGLPGASPAGSSGVCSSRLTASREESCSPGSPRTQQETGGAPYQPYAGLFAGPLTRNPETPQHPSSREGPIRGSGVRLGAAASRTPSDPPGCRLTLLDVRARSWSGLRRVLGVVRCGLRRSQGSDFRGPAFSICLLLL